MKRFLCATLMALLLVAVGCNRGMAGQKAHGVGAKRDVTGIWKGASTVNGVRLPMVLRFHRGANGAYSSTFESPDQHSGQIAINQVTFKNGRIHFDVNAIQFALDGALSADGKRIEGTWKQRDVSMAITLTRDASTANRPSAGGKAHDDVSKTDVTGVWRDVAGAWRGVADVGGGRRLAMLLTFHREAGVAYSGTFESPDQDTVRDRMDQVIFKCGYVQFVVNAIQFSFEGSVSADGKRLEGTWKQRGVSMPITLTRE